MINKTSITNRKIYPKETKPAELLDYELYFFGKMGMAEALPKEGNSFHGVVHAVSEEEMQMLDKIESVYVRSAGKAKLYDGSIVDCTVYTRENKERGAGIDMPPTERYIEIIV